MEHKKLLRTNIEKWRNCWYIHEYYMWFNSIFLYEENTQLILFFFEPLFISLWVLRVSRRGQTLLISNVESARSRLFAGIFFKILQVELHIAPPGKKSLVRLCERWTKNLLSLKDHLVVGLPTSNYLHRENFQFSKISSNPKKENFRDKIIKF